MACPIASLASGAERCAASRAIAEYLLGDPDASEIVCALPRDEFGFVRLGRDLTGFTGWIDFALAARAQAGKGRRRATMTST
jgi:hypothetical protein